MPSESRSESMMGLIRELYPICRSITGDGVRETLRILQKQAPLEIHEVPTGTEVLDWTVPREWKIRDAWVKNSRGEKVIDFQQLNLHVLNYSAPFRGRVSLEELREHTHTHPGNPDWVPYRTSYYNEAWGLCMSQRQLDALDEDSYEVCIDSSLDEGSLSYGELFLPGESDEEIVFSAHVCHPSLCNDNLSGLAISVQLAQAVAAREGRRYGYRFLYIPGTIGSITWLARNKERTSKIRGGATLVCLGDERPLKYKRSLAGDALMDRAFMAALRDREPEHALIDFYPYGYDERQFNSPGFRIPFGSLMRGQHGQFPEYHSSADNLELIQGEQLDGALQLLESVVEILETDRRYRNLAPYGEPQLGKRGIYRAMGGYDDMPQLQFAMLWVLNLSDAEHSLLDIAERAELPYPTVLAAAQMLRDNALLEGVSA